MSSQPPAGGLYTTAELAAEWRCSEWKVRKTAKSLNVGLNLGGRAGYRYTEADRAAMAESLRVGGPVAKPTTKRRKRRAA